MTIYVFSLFIFCGCDKRSCEQDAKLIFAASCEHFDINPEQFQGVFFIDFPEIEDFFEIDIVVYELQDKKAKLIQRSRELHHETMQWNVFKNDLSLIADFEKYCGVYQCQQCDKLRYGRKHFLRHTISCDQTVTQSFPGGIFKNQPTIFQKLEDIGIFLPHDQRHYPFYCCYYFESILSQDDLPKNGEKLSFLPNTFL